MRYVETLNLKQAADFLHMSPSTLGYKARIGEIKAAKPGRRWVFIESDLISYLRSLQHDNYKLPSWDDITDKTVCQSTNEEKLGGLDSRHPMGKEYANLLKLETGKKLKNSATS